MQYVMAVLMFVLTTVIPWLFVITVVITIHELSHYFAARLCGVKVERASLGFGKPIPRYQNPGRLVIWQLCWIPLGGYVKFAGDPNVAGARRRTPRTCGQQIIEAEGPALRKNTIISQAGLARLHRAASIRTSSWPSAVRGRIYMAAGELDAPLVVHSVMGSAWPPRLPAAT